MSVRRFVIATVIVGLIAAFVSNYARWSWYRWQCSGECDDSSEVV